RQKRAGRCGGRLDSLCADRAEPHASARRQSRAGAAPRRVLLRADRAVRVSAVGPSDLKLKPWTRRLVRRWLASAFFVFALVVLLANRWVINSTDAYIYKDWALMPDAEVGVVLGTSKYLE